MHLMIADRKQRENAGGRKQRSFQQTRKQRSFPSFPGMSIAGNMPGTILDDPTEKTTSSTTAL
jgi:hypothetical protein